MPDQTNHATSLSFLSGDGEMAGRIRSHDWASTPLGAPATWSAPLKAMVRMLLTTRHPIYIFWGPEHIGLYNDGYRASLGDEKHPALLGMPGRQAWPEIWSIIGPQIDFVLRGDGATWDENRLVPIVRHGALQDVYWTYSYGPIDDADAPAGIGGVLVIVTETTQQVLSERRLKAERERFAELFEQAPTFMAVLRGPEHRFELVNPGYLRLIGHREVIGRTVAEALPDAIEQGYGVLLDEVWRSGQAFSATGAKFAVQPVPGGPVIERWVDFVYQPILDGSGAVTGIFVDGFDVSDRREVERLLRDSEERFRLAVESSQLGTFDLADGQLALSPRGAAQLGLASSVVPLDEALAHVHPDDRARVSQAIARAHDPASDGSYHVRHRVAGPDGAVRWLAATGRVSRQPQGDGEVERERFVGVIADITEQQQLMDMLREADHRKDEFLATLAHELRNPLAPIRTAAHMLTMPHLAADRVQWCGKLIQRQSTAMALLLDDLLEVSRISSGKLELRRAPVAVSTIVDSALETAQPVIEAKGHALEVALPAVLPTLDVDALRVAQVLTNLLTNAAKYTDPGGHLSLQARVAGDAIEFDVVDDGIGLDAAGLQSLFEMFHQVRGTQDRAQGGLGIGLALSQGLAGLHGGRVEAFSDGIGQGSTFRLTLPL